ncbi:hypothetical protein BDV19DRAFT_374664 [Aspergillus venezuelensis]
MRPSLRRSCDVCTKFKLRCDLRTPRCSRCVKRNVQCVYANQPLTAPLHVSHDGSIAPLDERQSLSTYGFGSLDPFDSYPPTRLPRQHVQRLIHSFLHKIAFQYYPLDLSPTSNPFLVSWWPLALGDPALFHVSLQTACLDEELLAQKGFRASEILMADSVALLRQKVMDTSLAVQDGTMDSVITLAAIEFGKGNVKTSKMHVHGVKKLVEIRGGINSVRQTSPLTARMVSWVSMIVMGHPQFRTQDDTGVGDGIPLIPEWQYDMTTMDSDPYFLSIIDMLADEEVINALLRLRGTFERASRAPLSSTRLHDFTCFVIHRLLLHHPDSKPGQPAPSPTTECIRYATILYMLFIHGPTYYSHEIFTNNLIRRLISNLETLYSLPRCYESLDIWIIAIGLVASLNTPQYGWFVDKATHIVSSLQISSWIDILAHIKAILWMETAQSECIFRSHWDTLPLASGQAAILADPVLLEDPVGCSMDIESTNVLQVAPDSSEALIQYN